jgi:DNA-damage-inducible protein J
MAKTSSVQGRLDPELKNEAENILRALGLTHSQFINIAYRLLRLKKGLPFDVRIPAEATRKAIERLEKGEGVSEYDSVEELFKDAESW